MWEEKNIYLLNHILELGLLGWHYVCQVCHKDMILVEISDVRNALWQKYIIQTYKQSLFFIQKYTQLQCYR
jgi:hypothetical protein